MSNPQGPTESTGHWAVIGRGPSVRRRQLPADVTVVRCNHYGGLPTDYVMVVEKDAVIAYEADLRAAIAAGVPVVAAWDYRVPKNMPTAYQHAYNVLGMDVVKLQVESWGTPGYHERYPFHATCGAVALQWAVSRGARHLHVVGFDGYDASAAAGGLQRRNIRMNKWQCEVIEGIVQAHWPEVHMTFYGRPCYPLSPEIKVIE